MKSTIFLLIFIGDNPVTSAFSLPRSYTTPHRGVRTALSASSVGEALKRGFKFLLVPNAKPPAPAPQTIPDLAKVTTSPEPPVTAMVPPPDPVVVAPPPPPVMVVEAPPAPVVTTPPPLSLATESLSIPQDVVASASVPASPDHPVPRTIASLMPPDFFWRTHKPVVGVSDPTAPFQLAPRTPPPVRPSLELYDASGRWDASDFRFNDWLYSKLDVWKAPAVAPVNTGPPKSLENLDLTWDYSGKELPGWAEFRSSFDALQLQLAPAKALTENAAVTWKIFTQSILDVAALVEQGRYSQSELEKALNLPQTAAVYLIILGTFGVMSVNSAGPAKTPVAVNAPSPAMGANQTMNAVLRADRDIAQREAKVVNQVDQLTQATMQVTEQLAELQSAKAQRDYDVATMKSDMREMRNLLDVTRRAEIDLRDSLTKTQAKLETETKSLKAQLQKRIEAEASVRAQLQETKAQLEMQLREAGSAKIKAEKEVAESQKIIRDLKKTLTNLEKVKEGLEEEVAALKAEISGGPAPKASNVKGTTAKQAPASPPVVAKTETDTKKGASKTVTKKKTAVKKKKQSAKQEEVVLETLSTAFFANISEPVGASVAPAKKAVPKTSKKAPRKVTVEAAPNGENWSSMSPATLKRKTVKDLTNYLASHVPGAKVTGPDGKALRKDLLVEQILAA